MRQFASSGFRIWNLPREAKVVYSFFGLFSLLALASSMLLYEDLVGGGTSGVRSYYAGEAASTASAANPPTAKSAGPEIALPFDQPTQAPLVIAATRRKLLEVTHFHLFTVPVYLLIITHLFLLTGLGVRAKFGWITGGWLAALAHLAAPWLVHFGGGGFAPVYVASGALLAITCLVLTAYPIGAMWFGSSSSLRPPSPGD